MSVAHPRSPRIAVLGLARWDHFLLVDEYPGAGSDIIVNEAASQPGGAGMNSAVALARLGARVSFVSRVGDDDAGRTIRARLDQEVVDTAGLAVRPGESTCSATIIISRQPPARTVFVRQGARLARGDRLDVAGIFGHDLVLVDVADLALRRFLVDLPAHTAPATRLLGALTDLVESGAPDALALALGHDAIVGNERELLALTGAERLDAAIATIQSAMRAANLRACAVTRGALGATIFTGGDRWDDPAFSVTAVDTTGAGDAFAAGLAFGMALRWPWPRVARFANAVAALSTRALGAQSALPSLGEVASLLGVEPITLIS